MSGWIRLATTFPRHPKALAAGPVARHLFIVGLCWSGEYDTDGRIPGYVLNALAVDAGISPDDMGSVADRLVEVGLWIRCADGWQVHDWGQWQATSAERDAARNRNRDRQRAWRDSQRKAAEQPDTSPSHAVTDASRNALVRGTDSESDSESDTESSSSSSPGPLHNPNPVDNQPDDDDETIEQTIEQLGDTDHRKAIADGVPIRNPQAHRTQCIRNRDKDRPAIRQAHSDHPDWTPTQLANHITNPPNPDRAKLNRALGIPI